jgi:hypothetical protein
MADAFVIEVDGEAAGIVVRDDGDYLFYASDFRYSALEGEPFPSAEKATLAAREIGRRRFTRAA